MTHRQVDVGELGLSRETHLPQRGAGGHALAGLHHDAAARHVAVLGLPTAAVIDEHAVAALPPLHVAVGQEHALRFAVAAAKHLSRRRRQHPHALALRDHVGKAEIHAVVLVVDEGAAGVVARAGAGIMVDVLLDHAGLAYDAVEGQAQLHARLLLRGRRRRDRHAGREDEVQHAAHPCSLQSLKHRPGPIRCPMAAKVVSYGTALSRTGTQSAMKYLDIMRPPVDARPNAARAVGRRHKLVPSGVGVIGSEGTSI